MHSPAKAEHYAASLNPASRLQAYVNANALDRVGHEKWLVSLTRNDDEPDVCIWGESKAAGFDRKQTRFPAPDLAVEVISPGTEAIDRGVKLDDCAALGVTEYWAVDPDAGGFTIPIRAIFDADENPAALNTLLRP